jgi:hypothetical protein
LVLASDGYIDTEASGLTKDEVIAIALNQIKRDRAAGRNPFADEDEEDEEAP